MQGWTVPRRRVPRPGRGSRAWLALAASLALLAPPAVAADHASHLEAGSVLVLAAGERVILRLDDKGRLELVSVNAAAADAAAPPKPGDRALGPRDGNPLVEAPEGSIAVVMSVVDGTTLLKIENGTSTAFDYEAWIPRDGGGLEPTSVCTVLPLLAGYEQWPGRGLSRLVLNRFSPRRTNQVACPQPSGPPPAVSVP